MSPGSDRPADPRIEVYLRQLTASLTNVLSTDELDELRANVLFHLECLVDDDKNASPREKAVEAALAQFGCPERTGLQILDEWCRGRSVSCLVRSTSSAFWWSLAVFGLASALSLLAVQLHTIWFGGEAAFISRVVLWLPPIVAGSAVGYKVPTGNLRAFFLAMIPIAAHALVATALMRPYEGATFASIFILAWLPVGGSAIVAVAWLRRRRTVRRSPISPQEVVS